jgi:hypothetical protein
LAIVRRAPRIGIFSSVLAMLELNNYETLVAASLVLLVGRKLLRMVFKTPSAAPS